jgi:hypoxanthine phosphoribosyltransferase
MVTPAKDLRGTSISLEQARQQRVHIPEAYEGDLLELLATKKQIDDRILQMGRDIASQGHDEIYAVCVLDGAMPFYVQLLFSEPMTEVPVIFKTTKVDSGYDGGTKAIRQPRILNPDFSEAHGKRVYVIDDIGDTRRSLDILINAIGVYSPKSIEVAVLLDKPSRQIADVHLDHVGFTIDDKFVVGRGLDFDQKYRGFKHIGVLKPEIYLGN